MDIEFYLFLIPLIFISFMNDKGNFNIVLIQPKPSKKDGLKIVMSRILVRK